jgi:hypothetical protein
MSVLDDLSMTHATLSQPSIDPDITVRADFCWEVCVVAAAFAVWGDHSVIDIDVAELFVATSLYKGYELESGGVI